MKRPMVVLCLSLATLAQARGHAGPQFHGAYTGTTTYTTRLPGQEPRTGVSPIALRVSEGTDSDLVLVDPTGSCALPANVAKDVATLRGGTTCTSVHDGRTITSVLASGTAVVKGTVLEVELLAAFTITAHGQSTSGTEVQHYALTRIGP